MKPVPKMSKASHTLQIFHQIVWSEKSERGVCLALVIEQISFPKIPGVSLVSRPGTSRSLSFDRDEEPIFDGRLNEEARESKIDSLIWHRLHSLIKSKSIQFDMPKLLEKSAEVLGIGGEDEEENSVDGKFIILFRCFSLP